MNALQHVATHYNTLPQTDHTATHCTTLQHTTTHYNTLQHTNPIISPFRTHGSQRQPSSMHLVHALQHTVTHCNTLQHTAIPCNTLQRIASRNPLSVHRFLSSHLFAQMEANGSGKESHLAYAAATHCNTLKHAAPHYSTWRMLPQHIATY